MKKLYPKKKFVATGWWWADEHTLIIDWEEGIHDKYGLHYTDHTWSEPEVKRCKRKRNPFAFNTYEEMEKKIKRLADATNIVYKLGNIRKEAVFLILEFNEEGYLYDPYDFDGYVSKRGTVFNITSSGTYDGKKRFALTEENKHLVFPDIVKAANYVEEHYGHWAASHYLKNTSAYLF